MSDIPLTEQVARALLPDDQHDVYADQDWPSNVPKAKEVIGLVVEALIAKAELDPSLHVVSMLTPQHGVFLSDWLRDHRQPPDDPDDD